MNKHDINDSLNAKIIDISTDDDPDETLEELKARLADRAQAEECDRLTKSLRTTVSNFMRRRTRYERPLAKALRQDLRLVLPTTIRKA